MANLVPTSYSFELLFAKYAAKDIFNAFQDGVMPGSFQPNNRYDELLHDDVLGFVFHHPIFQEWRDTLKLEENTSVIRIANECPVIETGYNLSTQEVRRFRRDGKVILSFMRSMAQSLTDRALPYEEVFAVIMDAIFTAQHVMGSNIENVH
ncbi:hypothetical protein pEaSNUABM8_00023 [Erwinia phage pEa_SNUABM_8]|nr:hypothetical protein pEaSNUABM8_00023 [Erwinia phage pEa_SNUABM_8]QVW54774.1 hypothetical protein pEaSNUABM4_00021 [Erwinia phage pEa_SNUABM_4]